MGCVKTFSRKLFSLNLQDALIVWFTTRLSKLVGYEETKRMGSERSGRRRYLLLLRWRVSCCVVVVCCVVLCCCLKAARCCDQEIITSLARKVKAN